MRSLDPPQSEENYLLREMGYRIARKHAARLRVIAVVLGFVAPIVLLPFVPPVAAIAALLGLLVERWLFFAEATAHHHTVLRPRGIGSIVPADPHWYRLHATFLRLVPVASRAGWPHRLGAAVALARAEAGI